MFSCVNLPHRIYAGLMLGYPHNATKEEEKLVFQEQVVDLTSKQLIQADQVPHVGQLIPYLGANMRQVSNLSLTDVEVGIECLDPHKPHVELIALTCNGQTVHLNKSQAVRLAHLLNTKAKLVGKP